MARACKHSAPSVLGHHSHTAEGPAFPGARLSLKRTCKSLACRRRTSNRDASRTLAFHTHCHCGGACLLWAAGVSHCGGSHHAVSLGITQSTPQYAVALPRPTAVGQGGGGLSGRLAVYRNSISRLCWGLDSRGHCGGLSPSTPLRWCRPSGESPSATSSSWPPSPSMSTEGARGNWQHAESPSPHRTHRVG